MTKKKSSVGRKGSNYDSQLYWTEVDLSDDDRAAIVAAGDSGFQDLLGAISLVLHDGGHFSIKSAGNEDFRATIIWTATSDKTRRTFGISSISTHVPYAVASVLHKYLVILGGSDKPPFPTEDEKPLFT